MKVFGIVLIIISLPRQKAVRFYSGVRTTLRGGRGRWVLECPNTCIPCGNLTGIMSAAPVNSKIFLHLCSVCETVFALIEAKINLFLVRWGGEKVTAYG